LLEKPTEPVTCPVGVIGHYSFLLPLPPHPPALTFDVDSKGNSGVEKTNEKKNGNPLLRNPHASNKAKTMRLRLELGMTREDDEDGDDKR